MTQFQTELCTGVGAKCAFMNSAGNPNPGSNRKTGLNQRNLMDPGEIKKKLPHSKALQSWIHETPWKEIPKKRQEKPIYIYMQYDIVHM